MKHTGNRTVRRILIAAACLGLLLASATTVYAADLGGIQRTIQLWIHGDQTQAVIEIDDNGGFSYSYQLPEELFGEGVYACCILSPSPDETREPLTEEEVEEILNSPRVWYEEDGSVWVYWYDQKVEITDKFEDGISYVKLVRGDDTMYLTVQYEIGYLYDHNKYPDPSEIFKGGHGQVLAKDGNVLKDVPVANGYPTGK